MRSGTFVGPGTNRKLRPRMTILASLECAGRVRSRSRGKPPGPQGNENIIMDRADAKILLVEIYRAAIAAVAPGPALIRALENDRADGRVWLIALGKAAAPRAEAAVAVLTEDRLQAFPGRALAGGLIVAPDETPAPHPSLLVVVGDHPEPAAGSIEAAAALERVGEE